MSQITSHIFDKLSKNIQFNIFCKQSISFNCKWPIFQTQSFYSGVNLYWFNTPISSHYIFQKLNSLSNASPSPLYPCPPSAYRHLLDTVFLMHPATSHVSFQPDQAKDHVLQHKPATCHLLSTDKTKAVLVFL